MKSILSFIIYVSVTICGGAISATDGWLVPPFGASALLLLSVIVGPNISLAQLFLQVVVLLSKVFHSRG